MTTGSLPGRQSRYPGKARLTAEIMIALFVSIMLYIKPGFNSYVTIPFFKTVLPDLGWGYVLLSTFIIVGTANAVNLTDGLDGLAIGPAITSFMTYLLFAYLAGNIKIANYLQIPYMAGTGELAIFCGAMVGAGIGFLWYNTYPAQVFMGDVGALSLGGALGDVAVLTKQEILLAIVGGLFVLETILRYLSGRMVQTVPGPAHLPDGPDASSFRAQRMAGAQGDCPFLDHLHSAGPGGHQHVETEVTGGS